MSNLFERFRTDTSGATAVEYGLVAGFIALVIIVSVTTLGTRLNAKFSRIGSSLT